MATADRTLEPLADGRPRVSIGLPVYNGERHLEKALDSLLSQTFTDFELIISDNASDDGTRDIAQRYAQLDSRIRYHRNDKNLGAARNFNNTFAMARGQYFKWAACDDIHLPGYLDSCVRALDRIEDAVLAYPLASEISEEGSPLSASLDPLDLAQADPARRVHRLLWELRNVHMVFGLMRVEAVKKTRLLLAENGADRLFLLQMALQGPWFQVDEMLFVNRATRSERDHRTRRFHDPSLRDRKPFRRLWLRHNQMLAVWAHSMPTHKKLALSADLVACYVARDWAPYVRRKTLRLFQYYPGAVRRRTCRLLKRLYNRVGV